MEKCSAHATVEQCDETFHPLMDFMHHCMGREGATVEGCEAKAVEHFTNRGSTDGEGRRSQDGVTADGEADHGDDEITKRAMEAA